MWNSQIPGFKLPESLSDKTPPPPGVEAVAGIGLGVFLVGMVILVLVFHALHVLNGFTWAVAIVVPGAIAALVVRTLLNVITKLAHRPLQDRAAYPRRWSNPISWRRR